jgi:(R,R)-butanediol dehydrogenase / meso-butanediol dehydrogenase / diacetyl reductase
MRMKAARFHGARDIRIEDVPPPGEPGPGEVLVEPSWTGICGTDLHEYLMGPIVTPAEPHPLTGAQLPQILGHEFSATVVATGDGVSLAPGDRVAAMPLISCGHCRPCLRGDAHLCVRMACTGLSSAWGALAELAIVSASQLSRIPDELTMEQGALIEPTAVAVYAVERARLAAGADVLISGAGPIGALSILAALALGAGRVFVSEPNPHRAERARELGATVVWDPTAENAGGAITDLTDGGVDRAIECSGTGPGLNLCVEAVRAGGVVVQAGLHTSKPAVDPMQWCLKDLTIEATWAYPVTAWPRIAQLIARGALPADLVVTRRTGLESVVEDGFDSLIDPSGREMKVLVTPREGGA